MALDFEQFKEFLEELTDEQISKLAPAFDEARKSASDFTEVLGEQSKQLKAIKEEERDLRILLKEKEMEKRGIEISKEHQAEIDNFNLSWSICRATKKIKRATENWTSSLRQIWRRLR